MKMAKASDEDMQAALKLLLLLNAVNNGEYPLDDPEEPAEFDEGDIDHLATFHQEIMTIMQQAPGALDRVILGFHTILLNNVLDPDQDVLELHPRLKVHTQEE